jgi:hypothetical protein
VAGLIRRTEAVHRSKAMLSFVVDATTNRCSWLAVWYFGRVVDHGPNPESSAHLLGQVHGHLYRVARRDEVFQECGGEVLGEDSPIAEAPQVEF